MAGKRADARRNEPALLDAAAAGFIGSGVDAPVRDIAAAAGVGIWARYLPALPTRADLDRRRLPAPGRGLRRGRPEPAGLRSLAARRAGPVDRPVRGLPGHQARARRAMHSDELCFRTLHDYFLERLVPVFAALLQAGAAAGQVRPGVDALGLMFAVGNLCIGAHDPRYDPAR